MLKLESPKLKILGYATLTVGLVLFMTFGFARTQASAQNAPAENAPAENSPAENSPAENSPAENTPAENAPAENAPAASNDAPAATSAVPAKTGGIKLVDLLIATGWFWMTPFYVMSVVAVTVTVERLIRVRRKRVLPDGLVSGLGRLAGAQGSFDPRKAYKLCQQFPSSAAAVIRGMLLKIGRPHSEVEHAVQETSEREANRLFSNARMLILVATVGPLWGLLGTVWGLIMAFHQFTHLTPGVNKAVSLADGIYTALFTTVCGLIVAIPSVIMAHHFETRIMSLFHEIDEMLFNLLPQVERFEGRVRFNRASEGEGEEPPASGVVGKRAGATSS